MSYINNQKALAYCTSEKIGLESMVSIGELVKKGTPKEVQAFIGSQGKRLGVDSVAVSTVERVEDRTGQTFYLSNSVTGYSVSIRCEWSSKIMY
jgi:hypothetical protein